MMFSNNHFVRRARKTYRCDYWRGSQNGGRCRNQIIAGTYYVEGEPSDEAGGFGHERYCLECAPEGEAALIAAGRSRPILPSSAMWREAQS